MWSNGAYVAASAWAFTIGVHDISILLLFVTAGSSLYHLHAERAHLWLDALFANVIFVMAILCVMDAVKQLRVDWIVGSALMFATLIWLFVASDLPGSRHYDSLHTVWHFVTAGGTGFVAVYIEQETVSNTSFELFSWDAVRYGLVLVALCCWVMRDTIERTFFASLRRAVAAYELPASLALRVTEENDVFVRGRHIAKWWFWVGYFSQVLGVFAVYSLGTWDLSLLLAGASTCAFLYHTLHTRCDLALDLALAAASLLAVVSLLCALCGYRTVADALVGVGGALLPLAFVWILARSACAARAPERLAKGLDMRVSHALLTICNAASVLLVVAASSDIVSI